MSKIQKIIMWLGFGMVILPELFWSPIINLIWYFLLPSSNSLYLIFKNYYFYQGMTPEFWTDLLFVQFFGLYLAFGTFIYKKKFIKNKKLFWILSVFLVLLITVWFFYEKISSAQIDMRIP